MRSAADAINEALETLWAERKRLAEEVERLDAAIGALGALGRIDANGPLSLLGGRAAAGLAAPVRTG